MAILDTFVSIFTADTDELKRGYDQAGRGADNIVDRLKQAENQSKKTGDELASMAKKAIGFFAAAVLANQGVQEIVAQAAEISRMDDVSDSINVAIEDVDAFGKAMQYLGGDKSDAEGSLVAVFASVSDAATDAGSSAAKAFKAIGVSAKDAQGNARPIIDVLYEVSDAVAGMDIDKAKEYLATIGVTDRTTVEAIIKGRSTLEGMMNAQKEMGVVSKESALRAKAFEAATGSLTSGLDRAKQSITSAVLPAFTLVVEWLSKMVEWANKNKDAVVGFFIAIATIVAVAYLPAMISAAAATIAALSPLLLIAALVAVVAAAFALLYDDVMNFVAGNDSFIGQIIDQYPALGRVITSLIDAVKLLFSVYSDILNWLTDLTGVSFDSMGGFIKDYIHFLLSTLNSVVEWGEQFTGHFSSVAEGVAAIFEWLVEKVRAAIGFITGGIDTVRSGLKSVGGWLGFGDEEDTATEPERVLSRELGTSNNNHMLPSTVPNITAPPTATPPSERATPAIQTVEKQTNEMYERISESMKETATSVENFSESSSRASSEVNNINNFVDQANNNPLNSVTSNAISNTANTTNETNVQVGEIRIETQATDSQGIASGVGNELQEQLKNLQYESSTGVAR